MNEGVSAEALRRELLAEVREEIRRELRRQGAGEAGRGERDDGRRSEERERGGREREDRGGSTAADGDGAGRGGLGLGRIGLAKALGIGALGAGALMLLASRREALKPAIVGTMKEVHRFRDWLGSSWAGLREDLSDMSAEARAAYDAELAEHLATLEKERELVQRLAELSRRRSEGHDG